MMAPTPPELALTDDDAAGGPQRCLSSRPSMALVVVQPDRAVTWDNHKIKPG